MSMITGRFDSRPAAERAVERLVQEYGVDRAAIAVHAAGPDNADANTHDRRSEAHHGFDASGDGILVRAGVPDAMVSRVGETMRREGAIEVAGDTPHGAGPDDRMTGAQHDDTRHGVARADAPRGSSFTGPDRRPGHDDTPERNAADAGQPTAAEVRAGGPAGPNAAPLPGSADDELRPVNDGVAVAPAVRPAGPAAMDATGLPQRLREVADRPHDTTGSTRVGHPRIEPGPRR